MCNRGKHRCFRGIQFCWQHVLAPFIVDSTQTPCSPSKMRRLRVARAYGPALRALFVHSMFVRVWRFAAAHDADVAALSQPRLAGRPVDPPALSMERVRYEKGLESQGRELTYHLGGDLNRPPNFLRRLFCARVNRSIPRFGYRLLDRVLANGSAQRE